MWSNLSVLSYKTTSQKEWQHGILQIARKTKHDDDVSRGSFKGEPKYNVPVMISRNQATNMIKYVHIYIMVANNQQPFTIHLN